MASVPAWTKDWRPLADELCARIVGTNTADNSIPSADGDHERRSAQETLLLRTDRVVGQLYSHRFMDTLPQDVQREVEALETKFRVHSLEDRAQKLQELAPACDYQVLKLLLELSHRPTAATDEQIVVDKDSSTGWLRAMEEQREAEAEGKLLQEQLAEELFEISTNDEWFQPWDDDSDDAFSDWDDDVSMASETSASSKSRATNRTDRVQKTSNWDLGQGDDKVRASLDSRVRSVFADDHPGSCAEAPEHEQQHMMHSILDDTVEEEVGLSDEVLARYELLRRYFPVASTRKEHNDIMGGEDHMLGPFGDPVEDDDGGCVLVKDQLVPFAMERPWLLCSTVVHDATRSGSGMSGRAPNKFIHEQTVVSMVFQALGGFESPLFEFHTSGCSPPVFSLDFQTSGVQLSSWSRDVAVGHLSPSALYRFLNEFAQSASDLQLLRDLLRYLAQDSDAAEQQQCVTFEGLANALSGVLWKVNERIGQVELQINMPMPSHEGGSSPWSDSADRQPTLLGIYGGLKEILETISWLKQVMIECFSNLATRHWREIRRAEQAKEVLSSLYHLLEIEYVQQETVRTRDSWPRFDILLHLFVDALNPYLDLLNGMLFERGYLDTIPLVGELFFTTPASLNVGTASPMRTERDSSFKEGLLRLAPYEVNRALVPVFLEPVTDLMKEALASRQMKNRFLQQQQRTTNEPLTPLHPRGPSLRELFFSALEDMGWRHGATLGLASERVGAAANAPPADASMLEFMPFSRLLERCLTSHIEEKCRELSSSIAAIFRDKLRYLEHVGALRAFVLMEQQDVFGIFSSKLITQMRANPVAWADSERISAFHQGAIQRMLDDGTLSSAQRQLGGRISIRIDAKQLNALSITHKIDIAAMKCLYFTFSTPQPLRVLFSTTIMEKYSRLGKFLVQVKAVESTIVKFKHNLRHRRCYRYIERDIHSSVMRVADMLHYTKSLLNYLTNQISSADWSKYRQVLSSSQSLAEMNEAHEQYLDLLLNRFFLLEKHATVIQYIFTTLSHILRFVGHVDELVKAVERNLDSYFPSHAPGEGRGELGHTVADSNDGINLLERAEFRTQRAEMASSSNEFKRQSHFLVVMLTAMLKHGASPHVNEILTQLNYNYFYHRQEQPSRLRFQQSQPSQHQKLGEKTSRGPPSAPVKARVRNRPQYLDEI